MSVAASPARSRWLVTVGRAVLFAAGVGLTVWLVHAAGPARVLSAIASAGPWLPFVLLLEACIMVTDVLAVRALLGASAVPHVSPRTWLRSATLAYGSSIVLPAGRTAGEAIRAANLAPSVGLAHATGVCSRIQGAALLGNSACSLALGAAILFTNVPRILPYSLLGNAVICGLAGGAVLLVAQSRRFAAWVKRRAPGLADKDDRLHDEIPGKAVRAAVVFACLGRVVQTFQYGIVVLAVAGASSAMKASIAQGVHLIGATVGDLIPNQVGAMEGAYRFFIAELGLADQPSRAMAIALIIRITQLGLAGISFAIGASLLPSHPAPVTAPERVVAG